MKYRIMKNERGMYRIKVKKWYGWSWLTDINGHIFETDRFQTADEQIQSAVEAPELEAKKHRWHIIEERDVV